MLGRTGALKGRPAFLKMLLEATPELNPPILGMSGEIRPMEALEVILGVECPPRRGLKGLDEA